MSDKEDFNQDNPQSNPEDGAESSQEVNENTSQGRSPEADLEEARQRYLYLLSEFETYKRRMAKERLELFRNAGKDLVVELLPVLDDFERGLEVMGNSSDVVSIRDGVDLVYQKFKSILTQKGLQPIEAVGSDFDVEKHEAISQMPAPSPEQANKVLAEVEKGYMLNEQVLRFSKVIVGS